jgi:hypothetical protein
LVVFRCCRCFSCCLLITFSWGHRRHRFAPLRERSHAYESIHKDVYAPHSIFILQRLRMRRAF